MTPNRASSAANPPGQAAIGRDEGGAGVRRLQGVAQDQGDRDRLLLLVGRRQARQAVQVRRRQPPPRAERLGRQQRPFSRVVRPAGAAASASQGRTSPRVAPEPGQQAAQAGLGVAVLDAVPGQVVQRQVQPGQYHPPLRHGGHHAQQPRHGGNAARGPGGQHRIGRRRFRPRLRLRPQQRHLPGGRVHHAVLRQPGGPGAGDDRQEFERDLPVGRVILRRQTRQSGFQVDLGALGLVHQRGQFGGERPGAVDSGGRAEAAVQRHHQAGKLRQAQGGG